MLDVVRAGISVGRFYRTGTYLVEIVYRSGARFTLVRWFENRFAKKNRSILEVADKNSGGVEKVSANFWVTIKGSF